MDPNANLHEQEQMLMSYPKPATGLPPEVWIDAQARAEADGQLRYITWDWATGQWVIALQSPTRGLAEAIARPRGKRGPK